MRNGLRLQESEVTCLMWNFLGMKDLCLAIFVRRWKEGKVVVLLLFAQEKGNFLRSVSYSKRWKISDLDAGNRLGSGNTTDVTLAKLRLKWERRTSRPIGNKKFLVQTDKFLFQRVSILQKTLAFDFVTDICSTLVCCNHQTTHPPSDIKSLPETWWPWKSVPGWVSESRWCLTADELGFFAMWVMSLWLILWFWSNYSDLTRPHPKWWFSKGIPLISGKSRLVKYFNLARWFISA